MTVTNNNEKNALAQEQAKHLMMSEILERYYHTGKHNKVCCPFHEEKTPSFTYKEGIFTCFGCGAKGDQVEFVRKYFDLDYIDALKKIDQDFGFGVYDNELSDDERKKIRDRQVLRERQRKVEQAFELEYIKACDELAEVDKKLIEIRKHGISDDNVIEYTSLLKTYEEKGYIVQDMEDQRRLREMGKRSQAIYNKPQNAAAKFPERKKCMKLEIHTRPNPKANKDAAKKILGWANLTVNDRITVCDIAIYQPEEGKNRLYIPPISTIREIAFLLLSRITRKMQKLFAKQSLIHLDMISQTHMLQGRFQKFKSSRLKMYHLRKTTPGKSEHWQHSILSVCMFPA